jgi:hypothetical protein
MTTSGIGIVANGVVHDTAGRGSMTQTGGFVFLFAWLFFAALLAVLAFFVLGPHSDPEKEAERKPEDPPAVP